MTQIAPMPVAFDDAELLRLVATPRKRLFPSLNRASAFTPLILVCCILPAILLLTNQGLDEEASLWGLRSLAVANSTTFTAKLEPGLNEFGEPLIFQPPLVAWLNGAVVYFLGPTHPLSASLVSLVATGLAIWLTTRCAWRIGGANTALISALLMCSHPQVLESAIVPTNDAVGLCLLLASVFGFQRHLERGESLLSPSLILSGTTWGLSLLSIGPIALIMPLIFTLHALRYAVVNVRPADDSPNHPPTPSWPAIRSTLVFCIIGLLVGGWWEMMMLWQHGMEFWRSWWSSLPLECLTQGGSEWRSDLCPLLQQLWQEWLIEMAMLIGWLAVGWIRAWRECHVPNNETARRRYQLLLLWWSLTFVGRLFAEVAGTVTVTNTAVWNVALLTPTILLASLGIGSLIERTVSQRGELALMIAVTSLSLAYVTGSVVSGLVCAVFVAIWLIYGPTIIRSTDISQKTWTEAGWRRLLKFTVYGSLVACLWVAFGTGETASPDEPRLADLRTRLTTLPEVQRISLIASRDSVPVALRYILRCRWPRVEIVTTEGWDAGLTEAMEAEGQTPHSRFLVLEWTRRDIRVSANTGQAWQISAVGNPMQFYGRRLSLVLIGPRA